MDAFFNRKVLLFGLLGAAGCLAGWALGEGLLWAALPAPVPSQQTATLVTRPAAPAPLPPASAPEAPAASALAPLPPLASLPAPAPAALPATARSTPPEAPPEFRERLDKARAKTGDVQISLLWNNRNDLDLHCTDPSGNTINFVNRRVASGGELDVDMNAGGPSSTTPVENIYWPAGRAPTGRYRVHVHHYSNKGAPDPTAYRVNVLVGGERRNFENKVRFGEPAHLVWEFEVNPPTPALRLAVPREIVLNQGSANRLPVRIARDNFTGPVALSLTGDLGGLTLADTAVPAGRDEAAVEIRTSQDIRGGRRELTVAAEGGGIRREAPLALVVDRRPPALRLSVPAEVPVNQGSRARLPVRIARDFFEGPVQVRLTEGQGLPATAEVVISADASDGQLDLDVPITTAAGPRPLTVTASGGAGIETTGAATLQVKAVPAAVRLAVPEHMDVNVGDRNVLPVRVVRDYFKGPATVALSGDLEGLSCAEAALAPESDLAEIEITAAPKARPGVREVRVAAGSLGFQGEQALRVVVHGRPLPPWSWTAIAVLGLWTALLAIGLSLALVAGQNLSLGRHFLSGRELLILAGGGLAAGVLAGGLGQVLLSLLSRAELWPQVGFVAGWILLGALLGWAVSLFIPNMSGVRATAAGAAGGLAGALVFLGASLLHDVVGRLLGAVLLGFFIGLMVALVEMAFRKAWLEVVYGPREIGTVNLGEWPIAVGSDRKACTVYARGAEPVAYRYLFKGGKVLCEDVSRGQSVAVPLGHKQTIGSVEVIVRGAAAGSGDDAAAPTAPVVSRATASPRPAPAKPSGGTAPPEPAVPPAPPPSPDRPYPDRKPATASPDRPYPAASPGAAAPRGGAPPAAAPPAKPADKPAAGSGCPGCGRPVPGQPGRRYCVVCDRTF